MKISLIFFTIFFLSNCSKPKTVLICGDHICINQREAEQYFEENLSIEVKIISKDKDKKLDLVELNLSENNKGKRKISLAAKKNTNQILKTLSNDEVKNIKKNIRKKEKKSQVVKSIYNINNNQNEVNTNKIKINIQNKKNIKKNVNKINKNVVDVCTILEKCSIDEISKYLLDQGKRKGFPDITRRQ